ncbi:MAG: 2-oxo acid dehydrogenase subunit E2 [Myxococcales bacterium]|nr:2-oxo acid dehydrogenase subunit E2 [Myxococcales bacterium]
MARLDFKLPDVGEGVTEGEIVQWFVAVGDTVAEDEPMVEVMTDKATVTIGAPCEARVERICFEVGAIAQVGQVILTLESELASNVDATPRSSRPPATAVGEIRDQVPGAGLFQVEAGAGTENAHLDAKPLATPATRRLAHALGVDLRQVRPSGAEGRVTENDVRALVAEGRTDTTLEERHPILGIRRTIAERMHRSKTTAAHFTFVEECDASGLVELRRRLLPEAERRGVRLTYLPFIVKAVAEALPRHPVLNAAVDERSNELVYKKYYNIGLATATEAGLMVPVVHDADRLPLFELASQIETLAQSARDGTIAPKDLRGSTFTVTSLGKRSGLLATPILNHPELGILGVHRIKEKPVVRDGAIVVGKVMLLSLSLDHRVVDGHVGAAFAYDVIETLENPERLFDRDL